MPLSPSCDTLIQATFNDCIKSTSSTEKKRELQNMLGKLSASKDDMEAYVLLSNALLDKSSVFSKAIDIKTGLGYFSSSAAKTRKDMDALELTLRRRLESEKGLIAVRGLDDKSGHGFGKILPKPGVKDKIYNEIQPQFRSVSPAPAGFSTDNPHFLSKDGLAHIFNRSGLDYKGQASYAGLTLLRGAGLSVSADLLGIFFPPAAVMGFSGSVSIQGSALTGSQALIFAEVINGANGGWTLPTEAIIKATLAKHMANQLHKLDPPFFDKKRIEDHMAAKIKAEHLVFDSNAAADLTNSIGEIKFSVAPKDIDDAARKRAADLNDLAELNRMANDPESYVAVMESILFSLDDRLGGRASNDVLQAIQDAVLDTRIELDRVNTDGEQYKALVVAGCMRSRAWEWSVTGCLDVGWSPLGVEAWEDVTRFFKTGGADDENDAMQYFSLGIDCGASIGGSIGCKNRSFMASDQNARLFAKGMHQETYGKFSEYISDSIQYATDEALRAYVIQVISPFTTGTNFKGYDFEKLKERAETFRGISQYNLKQATTENSKKGFQDEIIILNRVINLLDDRINQQQSDSIARFVIAYTGTTWEYGARAEARLGAQITYNNKGGEYTAIGPSLKAKLMDMSKARRTSQYTIQVPVMNAALALPQEVMAQLAAGEGVSKLKSLWNPNPPADLWFKTQETLIGYRSIQSEWFSELQAELAIAEMPLKSKEWERKKASEKKPSATFLNTIQYSSATAVWEKKTALELSLKPGSGRSYGEALLLTKLLDLADEVHKERILRAIPQAYQEKLQILARSLRVEVKDLKKFFLSREFAAAIPNRDQINSTKGVRKFKYGKENPWAQANFAAQEGCILIESTFSRNNPNSLSLRGQKPKSNALESSVTPESLLKSKALPDVAANKALYTLQSIRVRYRIADLEEDTSTPFKLGIGIPGKLSVGMSIEKVENVGMSGIVDIFTYWFETTASGSAMYNRAETVQSTVLITQ